MRPENVRDGDPLHRVVLEVPARMECRLEVDPANGRMGDREVDDPADLVLVDAALDGRHQGDVAADRGQTIQRANLLRHDVRRRRATRAGTCGSKPSNWK